MSRNDLDRYDYDSYLASRSQGSRVAREELRQRTVDRRNANDGFKGYHFGLGDKPIKTEDIKHFKHELDKRGLIMSDEVKKNLVGPRPHEFGGIMQGGRLRDAKADRGNRK
jgi:hypothetical protein